MFVKKFAAAAVALITAVLALPLFINDASASHGTDARIHDVDFGVFAPGEITGEEALNPEITVVGPEKLQLSGGYIKVELTGGETSAFVCGWNGGGGYLAYGTSVQSKERAPEPQNRRICESGGGRAPQLPHHARDGHFPELRLPLRE